jgi:hypothetical protein
MTLSVAQKSSTYSHLLIVDWLAGGKCYLKQSLDITPRELQTSSSYVLNDAGRGLLWR